MRYRPWQGRDAGSTTERAAAGTAKAKVIVVGPGEAGKSTLISRLCANAMNLEVGGRTVAMDHGLIELEGCVLSLVGVPGQGRFSGVRLALMRGARGAIWVHPADSPPDPETLELLVASPFGPLPYVVYVNHRRGSCESNGAPPAELGFPQAVIHGNLLGLEANMSQLLAAVRALAREDQTVIKRSL